MQRSHLLFIGGVLTTALCAATLLCSRAEDAKSAPRGVANLLDGVIQCRFQEDLSQFGISRMVPEVHGHVQVNWMTQLSKSQQERVQEANGRKLGYSVAFLHIAHKPGSFQKSGKSSSGAGPNSHAHARPAAETEFTPYLSLLPIENTTVNAKGLRTSRAGTDLAQRLDEARPVVMKAIPALKSGKDVEAAVGNRTVFMRPVRATKQSCLGCHEGAKLDDTLGVMVYIVDNHPLVAKQ